MPWGRGIRWGVAGSIVVLIGVIVGLRSWEAAVVFTASIGAVLLLVANSAEYAGRAEAE